MFHVFIREHRAHVGRVDDVVAACGGGALSLSAAAVKLHNPGGLARLTIQTDEVVPSPTSAACNITALCPASDACLAARLFLH